jgi:glutamate/aspartate transport system substrate-binding protein
MKTLWSKWFVQPIPPRGIRMNMEPPEALVKLWAQPNDLPMESYAAR